MGKQFLEITEQREVERKIQELSARIAKRLDSELVSIEDALGRVASTDIFSPLNIPPFDRATMDGYAVVASDTYYCSEDAPATLIVKAHIRAGEAHSGDIKRGFCMGISTGAAVPKGADAVVKVENTMEIEREDVVKIYKPVAPGENIMPAGTDIKRGEKIVTRGTILTARDTGVIAACGLTTVSVYKKPTVAIISTGDELIMPGENPTPGKIYDVNARTLSDSARECGAVPLSLGIARDRKEEIRDKIKEALRMGADVIILSGGTSAGGGDEVPVAIAEAGELILHGVDIKPGKPFVLGMCNDKPVFGLPGNPTSALITFNLFVAPLLRAISGSVQNRDQRAKQKRHKKVKAKTACRIFSEPGRNEYLMVKLVHENGNLVAYPILSGSGAITTLAKADGYIYMGKGREIIEEGEEVEVELLNY